MWDTWSPATCGIHIACSFAESLDDSIVELRASLPPAQFEHLIVFFSPKFAPGLLAEKLREAFPTTPFSGCTTAGEISHSGIHNGSIQIIAFEKSHFKFATAVIEDTSTSSVELAAKAARNAKSRIVNGGSTLNKFGLLLSDGLCNCEETLVASISWALGDIQMVGGSAGDDLQFSHTSLIHNGRALTDAAILMIVETDVPFHTFKSQNFDPTATKLVITDCNAEQRIVYEFNAENASLEYANAIGLIPEDLGPFSFASHPLVVKVGNDYYCRSIRNMNPDGSLSFFCAIDVGLVLTVARPTDLADATEAKLQEVNKLMSGTELVLGFDCILRRLDAENRQMKSRIEKIYQKHKVVGFHTYGEQYNAMHLNQTLTGIAFGSLGK